MRTVTPGAGYGKRNIYGALYQFVRVNTAFDCGKSMQRVLFPKNNYALVDGNERWDTFRLAPAVLHYIIFLLASESTVVRWYDFKYRTVQRKAADWNKTQTQSWSAAFTPNAIKIPPPTVKIDRENAKQAIRRSDIAVPLLLPGTGFWLDMNRLICCFYLHW